MYIIVRMVNKPLIMNIVLNFRAVLPNDEFIYRKTFNFLIYIEVYIWLKKSKKYFKKLNHVQKMIK